jgi:TolB-like protein
MAIGERRHWMISFRAIFWFSCLALLSTVHVQPVCAGPTSVAVWEFDNNSITAAADAEGLQQTLSEQVLVELSKVPGIKLVERSQLDKVLEEQQLGASELVEDEERLQLGRIIGAQRMVFGSFIAAPGQVRADLRVVEVETGMTKMTETATSANLDGIVEAVRKASARIAKKLAAE